MNKLFISVVCLLFPLTLRANKDEKITLRAHYGFVTAGYADLITANKPEKQRIHTRLSFKTSSLVDRLFRFTYIFDSDYEPENYYPQVFSYNMTEKEKSFSDTITYYHDGKYLESGRRGKLTFENSPRDLLSVISYLRKMDWSKYNENESVTFDIIFRKKEIFPVQVFYQGKEKVSVGAGNYKCIKLYLTSGAGKLFVSESKVTIHLSDDLNKVPVSFAVDLFMGSFKLDLVKSENLKYPLLSSK